MIGEGKAKIIFTYYFIVMIVGLGTIKTIRII